MCELIYESTRHFDTGCHIQSLCKGERGGWVLHESGLLIYLVLLCMPFGTREGRRNQKTKTVPNVDFGKKKTYVYVYLMATPPAAGRFMWLGREQE